MRSIVLNKGDVALVSDEDYPRVSQNEWRSYKHTLNHTAYAYRVGRKRGTPDIPLHRFLLGFPSERIDHINGNGLDNRRENLRLATHTENMSNAHARKGALSKYKGVSKHSDGKWSASITINKTQKWLGVHREELDAAIAYDRAAREAQGPFARLNFPLIGEQSALRVAG